MRVLYRRKLRLAICISQAIGGAAAMTNTARRQFMENRVATSPMMVKLSPMREMEALVAASATNSML